MAVATTHDAKVEALREQLPAVIASGYFNTGSDGPIPIVAHEAAMAAAERELREGRIVPGTYERNRERTRDVAALAAEMFGADADEIAVTHSASEGINAALLGIRWDPGDEVISTVEEHPGVLLPLTLLSHRYGVVTRFADVGDGGRGVLEDIAARFTSRTRVIALSHVLWSTGAVLPLREIAALAREHEVMVIVDGAQAAGNVPVDLHALGVDAYAMAGQKWLCGLEGTGLLFVRRDRFADITPTYVRYGTAESSGYYMPAAGAQRYEIGEFYAPGVAAQQAVLRWLRDDVGLDWAYNRIATLGAEFRERLATIAGVTVVTPAGAMGGLVNFNVAGLPPADLTEMLEARGYTIRFVQYAPCTVCARASIGWWNTEEEIAGLLDAIAGIASGARVASG